jgi:hypothetical protein
VEILLERAFSAMVHAKQLQGGQLEQKFAVGREPPFREDLSPEAGE